MTELTVRTARDRADLEACLRIRATVFVDEQGVAPEAELDEHEAAASHLLALTDGRPVGAMRWRFVTPGRVKIERVAVLGEARGRGIGLALMAEAMRQARAAGAAEAVLHAQSSAEAFYHRLDFVTEGPPFDEEGIAHVRMRRTLTAAG
jgi:predicted GNAT family N-acyltransferase